MTSRCIPHHGGPRACIFSDAERKDDQRTLVSVSCARVWGLSMWVPGGRIWMPECALPRWPTWA
eukprot:4195689-Pyramimonas_sp.AAC.1